MGQPVYYKSLEGGKMAALPPTGHNIVFMPADFYTKHLVQFTDGFNPKTDLPPKAWGPIMVDSEAYYVLDWFPYNLLSMPVDGSDKKTKNIGRHQRRAQVWFKQRNFTIVPTNENQDGFLSFQTSPFRGGPFIVCGSASKKRPLLRSGSVTLTSRPEGA